MSIYFQFKSCTVKESIPIEGEYISVKNLKESLIVYKNLRRGNKLLADLIIHNPQTNEDYIDDSTLIPRYTTVIIRRVPVYTTFPIIVHPRVAEPELPEVVKTSPEDLEWQELLNFIDGVSETLPSQSGSSAPPPTEIKALVETPALGGGGFGHMAPPYWYVCHRCNVAGHFIQHCPTNGDPEYDVKRTVAVLRQNEPSTTSSAGQLLPELYCRICKQVMKDAVLTSRCCYSSFCDRCIRGHIISRCSCVCGATNVVADHLIPNLTLRSTISRILESKSSSSSGGGGKQGVVSEPVSVKESAPAASQESGPLPDEDVQQKPVSDEPPARKKARVPMPVAAQNYTGVNPYNPGFGFGAFGDQQGMMHSGMESNVGLPEAEAERAAGKRKCDAESLRDRRL